MRVYGAHRASVIEVAASADGCLVRLADYCAAQRYFRVVPKPATARFTGIRS